ncbi:hypothetical protein GUJ93_ZPchr0008g13036 [Zizania palustris]|uniref:DUF1618 domain-containing protein n=1 Tax=Zizania palustris TaxID=103762 RepID=A0A8J5VIC0_ZIZPA|nr:hypothetical protein GUJ93_ZPchr0008g13036 [Zizania palustris]
MSLEFEKPPHATILTVHASIQLEDPASSPLFPYVFDVHSSGRSSSSPVTPEEHSDPLALTTSATRTPASLPPSLPPSLEKPIFPWQSIEFIELPESLAAVASTWSLSFVPPSPAVGLPRLRDCPVPTAHDRRPAGLVGRSQLRPPPLQFAEQLHLRYVPLPEGCLMVDDGNSPTSCDNLDKRRCVKLSEGMLRFVHIQSSNHPIIHDAPAVNMWIVEIRRTWCGSASTRCAWTRYGVTTATGPPDVW